MRRLLPCLLVLLLLAAACGDDTNPTDVGGPGDGSTTTTTTTTTTTAVDPATPEGELDSARQRWAENGLTDYRLTTAELCFCPHTEWIHTVVDGVATEHQPVGDEAFYDPGPRTMETLFDEIAAAIADGYETLEVDYDPETGAVERYWVDVSAQIADEEHGVEVTELSPFDPDASDVDIDAAALVDDYGCGYAFYRGSSDQTVKLSIIWDAGYAADPPSVTGPIELPDDGWSAGIVTGTDLFSNHCDDVIEADEPEPMVTSQWTIVEGTLTFTSATPLSTESDLTVSATLTGAVAESSNGDRVQLGEITLQNTCWGCFAG